MSSFISFYKNTYYFIIIIISLLFGNQSKDNKILNRDLIKFENLVGKSFSADIENKIKDSIGLEIVKWELALDGNAVKIIQNININDLISESIIMFDNVDNQFSCWSFTSGGMTSKSKLLDKSKHVTFMEDVSHNNNSITKIRTEYKFVKNNVYIRYKYFLINNVWTKGSKITFTEILTQ
jgi:hypothetical protein